MLNHPLFERGKQGGKGEEFLTEEERFSRRRRRRTARRGRVLFLALALLGLMVFLPGSSQKAAGDNTAESATALSAESRELQENAEETSHGEDFSTLAATLGISADALRRNVPPDYAEHQGHKEEGGGGHSDPIAPVLIEIILILFAAKIGGHIFDRLNQPAVLGELVLGIVIGSATIWWKGSTFSEYVEAIRQEGSYIDILARLGVILLLFEVGLESDIMEMARVGVASFVVATLGVIAPFVLGYFVSAMFIHTAPAGIELSHVHLFNGATLCATSVGITARVLKDLGKLQTNEAKIVLGAAVIDDVMGLVVLAVVSGIITSDAAVAGGAGSTSVGVQALLITLKAIVFLAAALFVGIKLAPHGFRIMANLRGSGLLITSALMFCFALAWIANKIGLATIVGAFAAGLVMGESHIRHFREWSAGSRSLESLIHPLSALVVPLFFVQMGIQVRLETFLRGEVILLAFFLTVAAIIGKQACGLGIFRAKADRLSVGLGMIPRGEVGLIFASIGKSLGVVSDSVFSAVVIMVIVTTLVTPPLLKWSMMRSEKAQPASAA